jgi:hypothetical protein
LCAPAGGGLITIALPCLEKSFIVVLRQLLAFAQVDHVI